MSSSVTFSCSQNSPFWGVGAHCYLPQACHPSRCDLSSLRCKDSLCYPLPLPGPRWAGTAAGTWECWPGPVPRALSSPSGIYLSSQWETEAPAGVTEMLMCWIALKISLVALVAFVLRSPSPWKKWDSRVIFFLFIVWSYFLNLYKWYVPVTNDYIINKNK